MAYNHRKYKVGEIVPISKFSEWEVVEEHILYCYTLRSRILIIGSKKSHWKENEKYKNLIGKEIWMHSIAQRVIKYYLDDGTQIDCILFPADGEYKYIKYVPTRKVIIEKLAL